MKGRCVVCNGVLDDMNACFSIRLTAGGILTEILVSHDISYSNRQVFKKTKGGVVSNSSCNVGLLLQSKGVQSRNDKKDYWFSVIGDTGEILDALEAGFHPSVWSAKARQVADEQRARVKHLSLISRYLGVAVTKGAPLDEISKMEFLNTLTDSLHRIIHAGAANKYYIIWNRRLMSIPLILVNALKIYEDDIRVFLKNILSVTVGDCRSQICQELEKISMSSGQTELKKLGMKWKFAVNDNKISGLTAVESLKLLNLLYLGSVRGICMV